MSKNLFKTGKFIPAKKFIVGVDIGKKRHCARGITRRGEYATHKPFWFGNNRDSFEAFSRQLTRWMEEAACKDVVVGMEPTGPYWKPLAFYLEKLGMDVYLVSPSHTKKMKELYDNSPKKSDPKDALLIARMVDEGKFLEKVKRSDAQESLKQLTAYREWLMGGMTACKNRIRSMMAEYFPEMEGLFSNIGAKTLLAILKKYPLPCDIVKLRLDRLVKFIRKIAHGKLGYDRAVEIQRAAAESIGNTEGMAGARLVFGEMAQDLECLIERKKKVEAEMTVYLEQMEEYKFLKSIPDVGPVTAASVFSAVGSLGQYRSPREILKLLGMQVYEISSGKHQGKRHITKRGSSLGRAGLYRAAVRMSRKKGIFRGKYLELKARGKPAPLAFVAIARRLVNLMFSLVRDKRKFESDYAPKHLRIGKAERNEKQSLRKIAA